MTNAGGRSSIDDGAKLGTLGALCLFLLTSTLPILFIYAYSGIGVDLETALESKQTSDDAEEALTVVGTALLIAYLFDLNVLNPRGMLSKFLATALAFLTVISLLLLTGKKSVLDHLYLYGGGTALADRAPISAVSRCRHRGLRSENVRYLGAHWIRHRGSVFGVDCHAYDRDRLTCYRCDWNGE